MAKFSGSTVKPGESVVQEELPVADLKEQTPQAEPSGSIFDEFQPAQEALPEELPELPPEQIEEIYAEQEQAEREAIPDIRTRLDQARAESAAGINTQRYAQDTKDIKKLPTTSADGGLERRARNLSEKVATGQLNIKGMFTTGAMAPIVQKAGVPADPQGAAPFLGITSYVVENMLGDITAASTSAATAAEQEKQPEVSTFGTVALNPEGNPEVPLHKANERLGRELFKEWSRYSAAQQGVGATPEGEITNEEATMLGQAAKELYFEANKDDDGVRLMNRRDPDGTRRFVTYEITKQGADAFKKGEAIRKALFPRPQVRPQVTPTPGGFQHEGKEYTKGVTGKKGKGTLRLGQVEKAVDNLNSIPNVVDPQRMRILFATIIPALKGEQGPLTDAYANIYGIGTKKMGEFEVQRILAERDGVPYDVAANMDAQKRTVAQSVFGVAQERGKANHLTYDITAYNGRLTPQQTHFDPTNSKVVRFVTRNATPVKVTQGSRAQKNIDQMYAMLLVKDADKLLPDGRRQALKANASKLRRWGIRLQQLLDQSMTNEQAEAVANAISEGIPLNDERFPQVQGLALDPEADADLIAELAKKDEGDGGVFLDALMDFAVYQDKMEKGLPHNSYLNVYIDGKTNGIASNGLQLGNETIALRTGVTRTSTSIYAVDNDIDIRDELANVLANNPDSILEQGFDGSVSEATGGNSQALYAIAKAVFNTKKLNKTTTMTYGYGKEMNGFADDIAETIVTVSQDPEYAPLFQLLEENGFPLEQMTETFFGMYASGLGQVMSEEGMEARNMMHGAALAYAMMDELFEINSPVGSKLRYGGVVPEGAATAESLGQLTVQGQEGDRGSKVYQYKNRATSAAIKETEKGPHVGGEAWGGAIPGPVQAIDSATIVRSVTGKSWEKLKSASQGNPYLHTIHDAFKLDANGYDVMLEDINNNWADIGLNWSYLEQTQLSLREGMKKFSDKINGMPANAELDITLNGDYRMIGTLIRAVQKEGKGGKKYWQMPELYKMFAKLSPPGVDAGDFAAAASQAMQQRLNAAGIDWRRNPTTLNPRQVSKIVFGMIEELNFPSRLSSLITKTNNGKKKIINKVKGKKIYQYYTH